MACLYLPWLAIAGRLGHYFWIMPGWFIQWFGIGGWTVGTIPYVLVSCAALILLIIACARIARRSGWSLALVMTCLLVYSLWSVNFASHATAG